MSISYRVMQDGVSVAGCCGEDAFARSQAYAYLWAYSEEGNATLQRKTPRGHWRTIAAVAVIPGGRE